MCIRDRSGRRGRTEERERAAVGGEGEERLNGVQCGGDDRLRQRDLELDRPVEGDGRCPGAQEKSRRQAGADDRGGGPPKAFAFLCLLYTSPSPRDRTRSRMPSS